MADKFRIGANDLIEQRLGFLEPGASGAGILNDGSDGCAEKWPERVRLMLRTLSSGDARRSAEDRERCFVANEESAGDGAEPIEGGNGIALRGDTVSLAAGPGKDCFALRTLRAQDRCGRDSASFGGGSGGFNGVAIDHGENRNAI